MKEIWFDMDGTIADLYGVDGWLEDLIAEKTRPYAEAKPLVNMNSLARVLNRLIKNGYSVNIVSWTSKNGTPKYNEMVSHTKKVWLHSHLKSVKFNSVDIIPYGTPKHLNRNGILFDDEEGNRKTWNGTAYNEKNILEILRALA